MKLKHLPLLLLVPLIAYALMILLPAIISMWLAHPFSDIPQADDVVRCDGGEGMTPPPPLNDSFVDTFYTWLCKWLEDK